MPVPFESVLLMGISALLTIGAPFVLYLIYHRRYGVEAVPALVGVGGFAVFGMVLVKILNALVLQQQPDGTNTLTNHPTMYILYICFVTGLFLETGRFVLFREMRKKYAGIGTALAYGLGHGGFQVIQATGLTMLSNLITILTVVESVGGTPRYELLQYIDIQTLGATSPYMFLMNGIGSMTTLAVQISLSVLVFYSVYETRRVWLYPMAILLSTLVNALPNLLPKDLINVEFAQYGMRVVFAVLMALLAVYTHRRLKPASILDTISESEADTGIEAETNAETEIETNQE
jgi:uncharacterized membrane protein YhfC